MLSSEVEKDIHALLLKGDSPPQIAQSLLRKKRFKENTEAYLHICRFMRQAGLFRMILESALLRLKANQTLPWAFLMEILSLQKVKVSLQAKKCFLKGILEQDQLLYVLNTRSWETSLSRFLTLKKDKIRKIYKSRDKQFVQLMEDLKFVQAEGILSREQEILKKLQERDPHNPFLAEELQKWQQKDSEAALRKRKEHTRFQHFMSSVAKDPERRKQAQNLLQFVKSCLKRKMAKSTDMAVVLSFMGYPDLAVDVLPPPTSPLSESWLYVDLLIQGELYLDLLQVLDTLQTRGHKDPEITFALTYARAQAYYGLGDRKKAKNLLKDLLNVRPRYRLARFLLNQWERE